MLFWSIGKYFQAFEVSQENKCLFNLKLFFSFHVVLFEITGTPIYSQKDTEVKHLGWDLSYPTSVI